MLFAHGDVLDSRYKIDVLLGKGATSEVYRATDLELAGTPFAIKVLVARPDNTPRASDLLRHEAAAAILLDHPNIARIYHLGVMKPLYLVMELIEGGSLHDLVRSRADGLASDQRGGPVLTLSETAHLIDQIADGLDYIHSSRMLHRDVKPHNVLVTAGASPVPKITDFGVALQVKNALGDNTQDFVGGTPNYMAPEQATGAPVSARADVYSLAATAYFILSGRPPFADPRSRPRKFVPVPGVPSRVLSVMEQALAVIPSQRPDSCGNFARALRAAIVGRGLTGSIPRRGGTSKRVAVQIPYYGTVNLDDLSSVLERVFATREFQRLRDLQEHPMLSPVFPSAHNTAYAAAFGCMAVALRIAMALERSEACSPDIEPLSFEDRRNIVLAAACANVGRLPAPESWPLVLDPGSELWKLLFNRGRLARSEHAIHSALTTKLLAWPDGDLHRALEQEEPELSARVAGLQDASRGGTQADRGGLLAQIVVVAQTLDQLMRSGHDLGLPNLRSAPDDLLSTVRIIAVDRGWGAAPVLCFDAKGQRHAADLLLRAAVVRHHAHRHRKVVSRTTMLTTLLQRLGEPELEEWLATSLPKLARWVTRSARRGPPTPSDLLGFTDQSLQAAISVLACRAPDVTVAHLAERLERRQHFKEVRLASSKLGTFLRQDDVAQRLERIVAPHFRGSARYGFAIVPSEGDAWLSQLATLHFVRASGEVTPGAHMPGLENFATLHHGARLFVPEDAVRAISEAIEQGTA